MSLYAMCASDRRSAATATGDVNVDRRSGTGLLSVPGSHSAMRCCGMSWRIEEPEDLHPSTSCAAKLAELAAHAQTAGVMTFICCQVPPLEGHPSGRSQRLYSTVLASTASGRGPVRSSTSQEPERSRRHLTFISIFHPQLREL